MNSTYAGSGHPTAVFTVKVSNTTSGESATAPAKTINVTDPPVLGSPASGASSLGLHDVALSPEFGGSPISLAGSWSDGNIGAPVSDSGAQRVALLTQYIASSFVVPSDGHGWTPTGDAAQNHQPMLMHPHA